VEEQMQTLSALRNIRLEPKDFAALDIHGDGGTAIPPLANTKSVWTGFDVDLQLARGANDSRSPSIQVHGEGAEPRVPRPLPILEDFNPCSRL
jgi:hypothetical protein